MRHGFLWAIVPREHAQDPAAWPPRLSTAPVVETTFMAIQCTNCSETIDVSSTGRLPPWCPKCGEYLNKSATTPSGSAPKMPVQPATPVAVGVLPVDSPTATSAGMNADPGQSAGFDETRSLAVHDFSLRGYLHNVGPGILLAGIFLAIAGGMLALAISRPDQGTTVPGLISAGIAAAFIV